MKYEPASLGFILVAYIECNYRNRTFVSLIGSEAKFVIVT